jgi:hypothetical protein
MCQPFSYILQEVRWTKLPCFWRHVMTWKFRTSKLSGTCLAPFTEGGKLEYTKTGWPLVARCSYQDSWKSVNLFRSYWGRGGHTDMTINRLINDRWYTTAHCQEQIYDFVDQYLECFAGPTRSIINFQHFIYIPVNNSLPEVSLSVFLATWKGTGDV